MKKYVSLLLVFVLVLATLAGCTPKTDEPAAENNDGIATTAPEDAVEISAEDLMANVNARKAISMAFDKTYVTDIILGNGSTAADYFVPKNLASDANGEDFRAKYPEGFNAFSADEAAKYWDMAKEELGFTTATVEFLTFDSETSKKISEFIQGQLQENLDGLTVVINQQPFKNKLELANSGDFDIEFAGWGPDYPDPMTFLDMWVTGGGHNTAGYSNPTYDENIQRTKVGDLTSSLDERWALLQETEKMLLDEDAVIVPLYQKGSAILEQSYVSGIERHAFGGDYTYKRAETTNLTDGRAVLRLLGSSDIPTLDTNKATNSVSFEVMANVNEGLYSLAENDVVEPGVAKDYTVSEDGLTYTFNLREDAVWSNGDSVTANDFVYSWRRLADPQTGSEYAFMVETASIVNGAAIVKGDLAIEELGVTALDDYTLEVQLEVPVPYFIKLMTFGNFYPVNQAFVEAHADTFGTTVESTLYNGPFLMNNWELGYSYGFEKNPTYWAADSVNLDEVTYRIVKDTAAGINLYETGEIDRSGLSGEFVEQFIDDPNYKEISGTTLFYIVLNIANR